MLAMAGMAVAAGATIGAGPAVASPSAPAAEKTTESAARKASSADRARIVGFYRNPITCLRAARFGFGFERISERLFLQDRYPNFPV